MDNGKVVKYMLWWDYKGWDDRNQKDKYVDNKSSKKLKIDQSNCLNSSFSNKIEVTILDWKELTCQVQWVMCILGFETTLSNTVRFSWKFMEHCGLSILKWLSVQKVGFLDR